jgi:transcriptional regulator GlxA family with amidase domain
VTPLAGTYDIRVAGGSPHLAAWISRDRLEEHLRATLARPVAEPVRFGLRSRPRATAPATIRRAVTVIEERAAEPLTVAAIASASGISVRALQEGFRRHLDTTPRAYLHEVRLRHARGELTAADPTSTTVTRVAARWGFLQPGRFAAQYRDRFGEPPAATLRR